MPRRIAICFALLAATATGQGSAQSGARRGAVLGGAIGAGATGVLAAVFARGLCDAADCSDAWIDGAVPGAVFGGLAGAALGGAIGALLDDGTGTGSGSARRGFGMMVDASAARAEWNSVDQSISGVRGMAGLQRGGLLIGPAAEWLTGGDWRMLAIGIAARLDPGTGMVRPFVELSAGRYDWRNPATFPSCDPAPPSCDIEMGTLSDAYVGGAGAVGLSLGDERGRWRVFGSLRYHFARGRRIGEPVSTATRALRQLSFGAAISLD